MIGIVITTTIANAPSHSQNTSHTSVVPTPPTVALINEAADVSRIVAAVATDVCY